MTQRRFTSSRIASLTDGIFAIAMTLLVLTIRIPDVDSHMSSAAFRKEVFSQLPGFAAWLISFAILCRLWISQHRLFEGEVSLDPNVATVNFVFLGVVSFIPYPTSLVSEHPQQILSVIIFSTVFSAAGILLAVMWRMMEHDKMEPAERAYKDREAKHLITWMLGAAVAACLLALVDPRLGILVWIVVPIMAMVSVSSSINGMKFFLTRGGDCCRRTHLFRYLDHFNPYWMPAIMTGTLGWNWR